MSVGEGVGHETSYPLGCMLPFPEKVGVFPEGILGVGNQGNPLGRRVGVRMLADPLGRTLPLFLEGQGRAHLGDQHSQSAAHLGAHSQSAARTQLAVGKHSQVAAVHNQYEAADKKMMMGAVTALASYQVGYWAAAFPPATVHHIQGYPEHSLEQRKRVLSCGKKYIYIIMQRTHKQARKQTREGRCIGGGAGCIPLQVINSYVNVFVFVPLSPILLDVSHKT